jgi:probable rRNA maturation factor
MTIRVQNRQRAIAIDTPGVKRHLQHAMAYLGCDQRELSIVWGNDRLLHDLNRTYRHQDRPTNVLAFPQTPVIDMASGTSPGAELLGDVIVSLPTAAREAGDLDQPLETRVVYLVIHGLLHLLGYDHEGAVVERQRMETLEQDILAYLSESY